MASTFSGFLGLGTFDQNNNCTELADTGYSRQLVTFAVIGAGTISNATGVTFGPLAAAHPAGLVPINFYAPTGGITSKWIFATPIGLQAVPAGGSLTIGAREISIEAPAIAAALVASEMSAKYTLIYPDGAYGAGTVTSRSGIRSPLILAGRLGVSPLGVFLG